MGRRTVVADAEDEPMLAQKLIAAVAIQKAKEVHKDIWARSPWKDVATLEANNVGNVGENFFQSMCDLVEIPATVDGSKCKEVGGGVGDGLCKKKTVEIKTARQGTGVSASFQHELGEKPWLADYMVFVDIAPKNFYLTIFENFTEEEYKKGGKLPRVFPTKSITWRKGMGAFKLDSTVAINNRQSMVESPNTFNWTPDSDSGDVKDFIDRIIN